MKGRNCQVVAVHEPQAVVERLALCGQLAGHEAGERERLLELALLCEGGGLLLQRYGRQLAQPLVIGARDVCVAGVECGCAHGVDVGHAGGVVVEVRGGGVAVAVAVDAVWGGCEDEVGGAEQGGGAVGAWP